MQNFRRLSAIVFTGLLVMTACNGGSSETTTVPTSTLAPLVSLTPRTTATPFITRTPPPTFTPIPSETPIPPTDTLTPSPTITPPVIGIVGGAQRINVREGPGTNYETIDTLVPGTGIEVVYQNPEGTWLNIKMEDGTQGWVSAGLIYIEATSTPFPSMTPSPDLTALALGTPLPTALIGGGSITPTPPRSAVTATPPGTPATPTRTGSPAPTDSFLPVIDIDAINMTATALAGGETVPISPPAPLATGTIASVPPTADATLPLDVTPTLIPLNVSPGATEVAATPVVPTPSGAATVQQGVDILAMCNDSAFRSPPPTDLAAGSTVDIFWGWFVTDPEYMDDHLAAVSYEVRINDQLLPNWRRTSSDLIQEGDWYVKYWYVRTAPLEAGNYHVTYRATWSEQITDGVSNFGPGTRNLVEEGSCDFVVR
jgi:hypothetical protein